MSELDRKLKQLIAGLEAQDWRETASVSCDWRRFGKFGRGAVYIVEHDHRITVWNDNSRQEHVLRAGELWFSPLHQQTPQVPVVGPILEQVLGAGQKAVAQEKLDTEGLLIELLYAEPPKEGK